VNPVDIRGQGASYLPDILKLFIEDDSYHILIVALGLPAVGELSTKIAEDLIKISSDIDKPLIVLWTGSKKGDGSFSENDGFRLLEKSAVPIFYSPEKCIRAVKSLISYHKFRKKRLVELSKSTGEISADTEMLHAQSFLEGRVDSMDEFESRQLLSCYGIPTVNERLAETVDEAIDAANEIGYPVVLKVVSKELLHKTEAGAIRLPINDENSLRSAYMEIKKNVEKVYPNANVRGILIQEMITVAREFIVGVFRDDQFGPVVVCGLGGIFTELYRDVSRRIPPLTKGDVLDMLQELKCFPMLKGYRGHQAADIQALVDVILRVGKMALDFHDRIAEIDINPLMVKEEGYGVCAVDSLVVLR
jgi:acetyltransferase